RRRLRTRPGHLRVATPRPQRPGRPRTAAIRPAAVQHPHDQRTALRPLSPRVTMNSTPWPGSRRRVEGQYAVKLGWKLAFAAGSASRRPEPEALLESYNVVRRPVAQHVLAATRALYGAEAGTDPVARFARSVLAPWATPAIALTLQQRRLRSAAAVRTVSQLRMHDRHSPLSVDGTPHAHGRPRPGDRL